MPRFKITYLDEDDSRCEVFKTFEDTPAVDGVYGAITAREWAEDYAYALADKGGFVIEEVAP